MDYTAPRHNASYVSNFAASISWLQNTSVAHHWTQPVQLALGVRRRHTVLLVALQLVLSFSARRIRACQQLRSEFGILRRREGPSRASARILDEW